MPSELFAGSMSFGPDFCDSGRMIRVKLDQIFCDIHVASHIRDPAWTAGVPDAKVIEINAGTRVRNETITNQTASYSVWSRRDRL